MFRKFGLLQKISFVEGYLICSRIMASYEEIRLEIVRCTNFIAAISLRLQREEPGTFNANFMIRRIGELQQVILALKKELDSRRSEE